MTTNGKTFPVLARAVSRSRAKRSNAEDALAILRKPSVKVDVLLTNIEMPGSVNGFELARRARELRPEIQVILTGTVERAADAAAGLCEDSPLLKT
jgi:two-component SAPR family response regulator